MADAAARPRVTAGVRLALARRHERLVLGVAGCVLLLAVWEAAVRLGFVRALFVSSPSGVARAAVVAVGQGAFWADVSVTLVEFSLGYLLAAVAGIALGLVAGWYPRVNHLASPWIAAWYATPQVAFVPLAILWFGIGLGYKVFYVFLVSFFTVAVSTIAGVEAAEAAHVDVGSSFGARPITLFRTVVLPGAVPHIVTGLRLAAGRAWVGVVIAELVGANQGLGFMVNLAGSLKTLGLQSSDVTVLQVGGESARIAALLAGSVAAAAVDDSNEDTVKGQGLNVLVHLADAPATLARAGLLVRRDWAAQHPDTVLDVVAANLEAQQRMYTDTDVAIDGFARWAQTKDRAGAAKEVRGFLRVGQRDLRTAPEGWENLREVMATVDPRVKDVDLTTAYTYEYLDKLKALGFDRSVGVPGV